MRKAAHGLVQYVQKAAGLTLLGLVAEFVRDAAGQIFFMGTLRTDWASLIPGGRWGLGLWRRGGAAARYHGQKGARGCSMMFPACCCGECSAGWLLGR